MKGVYQSILTAPGGNCHQACLATIFEKPLEFFPDNWGEDDVWYHNFDSFMVHTFSLKPLVLDPEILEVWTPPGLHLMAVESPRGDHLHCVVGEGGEQVWDPWPWPLTGETVIPVMKPVSLTVFVLGISENGE